MRPRPFYVDGGRRGVIVSAFGEMNVPEWVKRSKQTLKRKNNMEEEEENYGWFEDPRRESPKPTRRIGGIKLGERREEASEDPVKARSNKDRLPPSRPNEPTFPRGRRHPVSNGSSSVDSYRPQYRRNRPPRDDDPGGRDWDAKGDSWRRNGKLDRWTPSGSSAR